MCLWVCPIIRTSWDFSHSKSLIFILNLSVKLMLIPYNVFSGLKTEDPLKSHVPQYFYFIKSHNPLLFLTYKQTVIDWIVHSNKFICWHSNPQYDGVWRQGPREEVIRFWWDDASGGSQDGIGTLRKGVGKLAFSFSPSPHSLSLSFSHVRTQQGDRRQTRKRALIGNPNQPASWSWTSQIPEL